MVAAALSLVPPAEPNPAFDFLSPSLTAARNGFACTSLDDVRRIRQLKSEGLDAALARTVKAAESAGRCRTVLAGTKLFPTEIAGDKSAFQVRLSGSFLHYWIAIEVLVPPHDLTAGAAVCSRRASACA
jgi:hypothetical protein